MLITFEGTDCSGKETQSNLLVEALKNCGKSVKKFSFPCYDSPTGKIIAGPYLGKNGDPFFKSPSTLDPKVASLYFVADRVYNIEPIKKALKKYDCVIIDRYVYSNMAHQGCKLQKKDRSDFFNFIDRLEFDLLKLPKPDLVIFLYLSIPCISSLLNKRNEKQDAHECDKTYLKRAEQTYLELCKKYNFKKILCEKNGKLLSKQEISGKILQIIKKYERQNKK